MERVGVPMTRRWSGGAGNPAFILVTDVGVVADMVELVGCKFSILLALLETTEQR